MLKTFNMTQNCLINPSAYSQYHVLPSDEQQAQIQYNIVIVVSHI